jgi:aspartate racemase
VTDLSGRLASLTPAQRALFELALKKKEAHPEPSPAASPSASAEPAPAVPHRTQPGPWPLSFDQERLWRNQRRNLASPLYNIVAGNRFRGRLSVPAFAHALNEVVRRHESLRTTFRVVDGQPVQEVAPSFRFRVPVIDLRGLPHERREAEADRDVTEALRAPFDMERLPLFRMFLVQVEDDDFIRPFALHHTINDHLSIFNMEAELIACYAAFASGRQPELAPPPFQQADFAIWQRERLSDAALVAERQAWWRERLAAIPDPLEIPLDRPRTPAQRFAGERRPFEIARSQVDGLKALAQREGVTMFAAALTVFDALLVRLSGQETLSVGTPMTYREALVDGLLGFYLNQVPMPVDLSGNPTFREALHRVRDAVIAAQAHNDLPYGLIVEAANGAGVLEGPEVTPPFLPFTQMVFLFLYPPKIAGSVVPGLDVRLYRVDARRTQFDTQVALFWDGEHGISCLWEYNTSLWNPTTIDRFKQAFRIVLGGVLADPDARIWDLPLLSEGERHAIREWSDAAGVELLDRCGRPVPIGVIGETPSGEKGRWRPDGRIEFLARS